MPSCNTLLRLGAPPLLLLACTILAEAQRTARGPETDVGAVRDVVTTPAGEVFALSVERNRAPAILRLDVGAQGIEVLSEGGFLSNPIELAVEPGGELLVLDADALGGTGALLRIDTDTGLQNLLSFGGGFHDPSRLFVDGNGRIFVWDGEVVEIDAATGRQRRRPPFAAQVIAAAVRSRSGAPTPALLAAVDELVEGGTGGSQDLTSSRPPRNTFEAPLIPVLPPETMVLIPEVVWIPNGEGYEDDVLIPAGPFPLVTALKASDPNTYPVISVYGDIPGAGMSIGAGDSDFKDYVVHWGPIPMRFAVVGRNEEARIREFDLRQFMNDGRENGGIADVRFESLTIEARFSSCVAVPKGHNVGLVRFYDCHFAAGRENLGVGNYSGYGYKWGMRAHGRGRYDYRSCSFEPVEEHNIYIDSPQGDCYFIDIDHRGSKRTAIQVVNRSFDNPGPSGFGTLLFQNVRVYDLWGDGGSGISVAGHLGDLIFRDIQVRENPANVGSHGAVVVWTDDDPQKGVYLYTGDDGELYSTRSVLIESIDVDLPRADRSHVAISGVEHVRIDDFQIRGNRTAFSFDSPFGSPVMSGPVIVDGVLRNVHSERIDNGTVVYRTPCPLSQFVGFQSSISIQENMNLMSDSEIDLRWCSGAAQMAPNPNPYLRAFR